MMAKVGAALAAGVLGWAYLAIKPTPPKVCGSPGGPLVTSPRVQLSDGRYLAYKEKGVSKEKARYRIIVIHGFDSSKDLDLPVSQGLIEELQLYFLFFDRAGYGESDPNPKRTVKSEAIDIQELADKLGIGSKFYLIGVSMGAYPVWSCLNYIPNRLLGASLVVPFVHYWWHSVPDKINKEAFERLPVPYQWSFRIAHYTPWLINWWLNQKWFPNLMNTAVNFCDQDLEIMKSWSETPIAGQEKVRQQGVYESLYRDIMVGYAEWEFDPSDITNPFPDKESSVHIWQGCEDAVIPFEINRYLSEKLSWIRYHEVPGAGHFLIFNSGLCEGILRELLVG